MRAALRCVVPRAFPGLLQPCSHTRPTNMSAVACPSRSVYAPRSTLLTSSRRASGNGRGPQLEAENVEEDSINATTQQRPPSPRHFALQQSEMSTSGNATPLNMAAVEQNAFTQAVQAKALRSAVVVAVHTNVVESIEHWTNLAQEIKAPLDAEAFNAFASMYVAFGRLDLADSLWDTMSERNISPNMHYCTRMIRAWGRRRNLTAVDEWTKRAQQAGFLESDEIQHACVLAWGDCGEVDRVFAWVDARPTAIPAPFMKAFLVALGKNGKTEQFETFCQGLFTSWADQDETEMPNIPRLLNLDVASAVIKYHPDPKVVQNVFDSTQSRVARAAMAATSAAAKSVRVQRDRMDAAEVMSAMMGRYLAQRRYAETLDVLDTVLRLELPPTPSMCAEVLRMHAALGNVDGVEAVWGDMVQNSILPESDIFVAALQEFGGRKDVQAVDRWVERAIQQGFDKHPEVQKSFIAAWGNCGHPERLVQWARRRNSKQ